MEKVMYKIWQKRAGLHFWGADLFTNSSDHTGMNLHFGPKTFRINVLPQILDTFPPKKQNMYINLPEYSGQ
jgi:hypothetical protein